MIKFPAVRVWRGPTLFTRRNIWLFFRYGALYLFLIHLGLGAIAAARDQLLKSKDYGVVLISGHAFTKYDGWLAPLAAFGAYPYWTAYFCNRGLKTRWVVSAVSGDLEHAIKDSACVSIVLVGHGSYSLWEATDKDITPDEVSAMMRGLPKKRGEWLQLTCGVDEGLPRLGDLVMDQSRVYTYADKINAYYMVADALFGFKYLKSLKISH